MDEWNPRPTCGGSGEAILSTAVPYGSSGSISFGAVHKYIDVSRTSSQCSTDRESSTSMARHAYSSLPSDNHKNPSPERVHSVSRTDLYFFLHKICHSTVCGQTHRDFEPTTGAAIVRSRTTSQSGGRKSCSKRLTAYIGVADRSWKAACMRMAHCLSFR